MSPTWRQRWIDYSKSVIQATQGQSHLTSLRQCSQYANCTRLTAAEVVLQERVGLDGFGTAMLMPSMASVGSPDRPPRSAVELSSRTNKSPYAAAQKGESHAVCSIITH